MTTRNVILAADDAIASGGFVLQRETERKIERERARKTVIYQSIEIPAMQLKWFDQAKRRVVQRVLTKGIYISEKISVSIFPFNDFFFFFFFFFFFLSYAICRLKLGKYLVIVKELTLPLWQCIRRIENITTRQFVKKQDFYNLKIVYYFLCLMLVLFF